MHSWRQLGIVLGALGLSGSCLLACGSDDNKSKAPEQDGGGAGGSDGAGGAPASGEAGAVPGAGGGVTLEDDLGFLNDFCERFAESECAAREGCFEADATCVSETIGSCHMYGRAELLPAIAAGLLEYDAAKAEACFTAPLDGFCSTNNIWWEKSCREMFRGTSEAVDACYRVYFLGNEMDTCAEGRCDTGPTAECGSGRCVPYLTDDEPCQDENGMPVAPGCGPDRLCDYVSKRCYAERARHDECQNAGEACNRSFPRLFCVPRADGNSGFECDAPRPAGGACGTVDGPQLSIACQSLVCQDGLCADQDETGQAYCFTQRCPDGQACFAGEPPVCADALAEGATCGTVSSECAAGLTCVVSGDPEANMGTCQPAAQEGESCFGIACAEGLRCQGEGEALTCVAIVEAGGACVGSEDCSQGLTCLAGPKTCESRVLLGSECVADTDCEPGLYCGENPSICRPWQRNGEPCTKQAQCVYGNGCTDEGLCQSQCTP